MSELVDAHPCPNCGSPVYRVRRQLLDRLISNVAPRRATAIAVRVVAGQACGAARVDRRDINPLVYGASRS
jgi:hypothetical protein